MKLKELNKQYQFDKDRLKQWLINEGYISKDDQDDIYLLEVDDSLEKHIEKEQYQILHTPIRKKYQTTDEYEAPYMIPMPFNILNIDHFVVLDTETTGLYKDDEIVELSVIDMLGRELYHSLFKPQKKMGEAAIRITGLDNPVLENEPYFYDEWPRIKEAIGDKVILGHNIKFDYRITLATAKRYHIPESEVKLLFNGMIDSIALVKKYMKFRSYKLAYLCKVFGINEPQRHRATYDCLQTLQMLRALEMTLLNSGMKKETAIYELKDSIKEEEKMNHINKAIIHAYQGGKSIEDLSIFFGLSEDDIADILIINNIEIIIDNDIKEKILFVYHHSEDQSLDAIYQQVKKYAKKYEIKYIIKE